MGRSLLVSFPQPPREILRSGTYPPIIVESSKFFLLSHGSATIPRWVTSDVTNQRLHYELMPKLLLNMEWAVAHYCVCFGVDHYQMAICVISVMVAVYNCYSNHKYSESWPHPFTNWIMENELPLQCTCGMNTLDSEHGIYSTWTNATHN